MGHTILPPALNSSCHASVHCDIQATFVTCVYENDAFGSIGPLPIMTLTDRGSGLRYAVYYTSYVQSYVVVNDRSCAKTDVGGRAQNPTFCN